MRDVKLTATYFLTTDHVKSRWDQPVLCNKATGHAYLPNDALAAYESWPRMPATQVVNKMASWRSFSGEERGLIEQFLGIQPQRVAFASKTKTEPGSFNPLADRWRSR
ncbi:MAG: hypothetical protein MUC98_06005 [Desulfobacterota bacterium]|jgi:hypothetical protein|nr:hypothetical protein [Thermodesulfobacteriota bacterium]